MFNFLKRRSLVTDISWLGVDIHSHILPGIDDGAQSLEQSLVYINSLQALGFEKLFFTPHIFSELYPNNESTINSAFNLVKDALLNKNYEMIIGVAAEHMIDHNFTIESNLLCLPSKHILIEMSYLSETPNIENVIFNLQIGGYTVILAHPERYKFYHKERERYHRLKEMGCLFQLNLLSVVGYYGKDEQQAFNYLFKNNLYDLVATDLHHDRHLNLITKFIKNGQLFDAIGNYKFKNRELFL